MFAPSLAIGAGMGGWIGQFLPHTSPGAVVLLGMAAYFCGVAQSPLTATIIVMEICDNQQVTLALLATAFLAFGVSRMICLIHYIPSLLQVSWKRPSRRRFRKKLIRARKRVPHEQRPGSQMSHSKPGNLSQRKKTPCYSRCQIEHRTQNEPTVPAVWFSSRQRQS